jgi:hypothetical protein
LRVPLVLEIHEGDEFDGTHGEIFVLVFEAEGGNVGAELGELWEFVLGAGEDDLEVLGEGFGEAQ